jgi:hypothetical protein
MSNKHKNTKTNQKIGKIVSLKTHYTRGDSSLLEKIYIAGDDNSIPPFMMVSEYLKEPKDKFDSDTGEKILGNETYNYKVQWFNSKKYEISETWINSDFLDEVPINISENVKDLSCKKGDRVILKTNALELQKKRTSIKLDEIKSNIKASSVVNFCAPEMIVLSKVAFTPKKPIKDNITGEDIRFYPDRLLKCKYYNPLSDKYSEVLLPEECFEKTDTEIENLNEILDANSVILHQNKLLQVNNISYLHGVHMDYCKNFVTGNDESFRFNKDEIIILKRGDLLGRKLAPNWYGDKFYSIKNFIQKKSVKEEKFSDHLRVLKKDEELQFRPFFKDNFFYIHYRNLKGRFTERFIKVSKVHEFALKKDVEDIKGLMVKADCYLRGEERTFTFTDERLFTIYEIDETIVLSAETKITLKDVLEQS